MPDDTALRRAIDRQRENDAIDSMRRRIQDLVADYVFAPWRTRKRKLETVCIDAADPLDTEPYGGDLLSWACQRIDFWRNCYFRVQSRYDNLRRVCWICFGLAAVEFLIVIYATWGHS